MQNLGGRLSPEEAKLYTSLLHSPPPSHPSSSFSSNQGPGSPDQSTLPGNVFALLVKNFSRDPSDVLSEEEKGVGHSLHLSKVATHVFLTQTLRQWRDSISPELWEKWVKKAKKELRRLKRARQVRMRSEHEWMPGRACAFDLLSYCR